MKKFIVLLAAMAVMAATSAQSIWYVTPTGGNVAGSGISWNYPCSLPMAVQQAVDGDQIWVKQGTYKVNLIIDKKLKIYGGFNGTESSVSDRALASVWDYSVLMPRHVDTAAIINVNPDPRHSNPEFSLFPNMCHYLDSFLLDGFILKGGKYNSAPSGWMYGWGAAIRTDSVNHIILKNLWIDSNSAFHGGGFYFEVGEYFVHNMTANNNWGRTREEKEAGTINMADVHFYNSIIWPDKLHIFYNHDNTVWFNNCCLWTTNQLQLQGWNPIPVNGSWSNWVWDYDILNHVITDNICSIDPLFNYTQLIPTPVNLIIPDLSFNSQFKDAAGSYESAYPGDIFDVMRRHRFEDHLDWGAFECQQNNRTLRLHAATDDNDRYIYVPLPSADTAVYYITSDSTVSAGSPTTHYFLNHKNIKEPHVVIPETVEHFGKTYKVTSVASLAFYRDTISSVTLPKSIRMIESMAFYESTLENISPLYCKIIGNNAFLGCKHLKNLDLSNCPIDTLKDNFLGLNWNLQWLKLPRTLVSFGEFAGSASQLYNGSLDTNYFVIIPPKVDYFAMPVDGSNYFYDPNLFPTIFLSNPIPKRGPHAAHPHEAFMTYRKVWWPCEYDSIYRKSPWGDTCFKYTGSYHFLNHDSGYVDLDSVCPWEAERRYGFHPDTIGLYIVKKSNPDGCDSFNIYFVKSFLDPGMILDTTIQLEVNLQDISVLWTWEGNAFAYNVYRDGDYLTTVEQPAFADSDIRVNVQYCYNFAPVNEKGCEGKWSTTNCYTMPADSTGIRERGDRRLVIHPNPAKEVLFISTVTDRTSTSTAEKSSLGATANSFNDSKTVASAGSETVPASAKHHNNPPYEVTDITGRIVLQGQYDASEGIPVGNLAKGMYLLRLEGLVGKFVKE